MPKHKKNVCSWCLAIVQEPPKYDYEGGEKLVCSPQCWWLEKLFCKYYSDVEIEMRQYFFEEGEDEPGD